MVRNCNNNYIYIKKFYILKDALKNIIKKYYNNLKYSYLGVVYIYNLIWRKYFLPYIRLIIKNYIKNCLNCN